jgi:hypothetical protein
MIAAYFIASNGYTVIVNIDDVAAVAATHPNDDKYVGCTRIHLRGGQTLYVYANVDEVCKGLNWNGERRAVL